MKYVNGIKNYQELILLTNFYYRLSATFATFAGI